MSRPLLGHNALGPFTLHHANCSLQSPLRLAFLERTCLVVGSVGFEGFILVKSGCHPRWGSLQGTRRFWELFPDVERVLPGPKLRARGQVMSRKSHGFSPVFQTREVKGFLRISASASWLSLGLAGRACC